MSITPPIYDTFLANLCNYDSMPEACGALMKVNGPLTDQLVWESSTIESEYSSWLSTVANKALVPLGWNHESTLIRAIRTDFSDETKKKVQKAILTVLLARVAPPESLGKQLPSAHQNASIVIPLLKGVSERSLGLASLSILELVQGQEPGSELLQQLEGLAPEVRLCKACYIAPLIKPDDNREMREQIAQTMLKLNGKEFLKAANEARTAIKDKSDADRLQTIKTIVNNTLLDVDYF